ncbi:hypothetical protein AN7243.2 [Aspergillus nidulans FGSC A4]|nr:hypothetical protein AN7243.2 [Aspergillus nidulans FGSC A4]|eukprot:XP_680512.1 hypothetical protein AN7243.2 [Aspergillus nidulans FGSC A4]
MIVASGKEATEGEERGIAIAVISFITLLHVFLPNWGVRGMNVIGVVKVVLLLFIVVTGWVVLSGRLNSIPDPYASFHCSFVGSATSSNLYATALFKVLNSFAGWSNAAYVLNEIRNPVRTLKIAAPTGLGICAAATPEEIANSGTTVASYFMGKVFGTAAERALSVLITISAFGNVMTVTFAQARVNQGLAKEGVIPFPTFWASSWPFGSPSAGLLLHFILSVIVIVAIPFGDAYNFILDLEGYPSPIINLLVVAGLFYLRYSEPRLPRPFKVYWPVAVFFMAGQAFQVVAPFIRLPEGKGDTSLPYWLYPIVGIAVLLAGVVYWGIWQLLLPWLGGYRLVPEHQVLKDGTTVAVYKRENKILARKLARRPFAFKTYPILILSNPIHLLKWVAAEDSRCTFSFNRILQLTPLFTGRTTVRSRVQTYDDQSSTRHSSESIAFEELLFNETYDRPHYILIRDRARTPIAALVWVRRTKAKACLFVAQHRKENT